MFSRESFLIGVFLGVLGDGGGTITVAAGVRGIVFVLVVVIARELHRGPALLGLKNDNTTVDRTAINTAATGGNCTAISRGYVLWTVAHVVTDKLGTRNKAHSVRRTAHRQVYRGTVLRLFYVCSDMFHLSGNNRREFFYGLLIGQYT